MSKGPALFSNFGQETRDLLTRDYSNDQKITIASETDAGLALSSSVVKNGGLFVGDVSKQLKYKNATVNFKVDTESSMSTMVTIAEVLPSTTAIVSCKLPDYNSGKLELQYIHEHAKFTTAVGLNKSPAIDVSATIGTPCVAFGTEATYSMHSRQFTKYNAGFSLTKPKFCASVILADKGDAVKVSYLQYLDQQKKGATVGEFHRKFSTNENTLIFGSSYEVDPHTLVKAKLDNHGTFGALMQHEFKPKSFLTLSGAFDTLALEKTPKFGLALALKP